MNLRKLTLLFFLCLSLPLLEAQGIDVKALAENDLFRGDVPLGDIKTERNKIWEDVSLSLLVQEVEAAADASGLESFSLNILNSAINIIYRDIRFLPDSSELTPETEEKISKLTEILERFSDMALLVQGHTAKLSPEDTDDGLELSKQRAQSVAGLISKTGIFNSKQIEAVGKGFYEPAADNDTPEGRALNRRVEISIVGSIDQDSDSSMVWWSLLSTSKEPGYTAYLVPTTDIETVTVRLDKEGFSDLIFASSAAGVGIIDDSISYKNDGTPDSESIARMQKIGSLLPLIQPDTQVRIGGYGADLSKSESEERHFLTAYTLGAIAGFKPGNITYSATPYVLTKATAALKAGKIFTIDGTPIELEGDGASFSATVPYSVDYLLFDLTTEDPLAEVTGLSGDAVALAPGKNEIFFDVESSAGAQKVSQSYRLTVVRQKPEFQLLSISSEDQTIAISPEFSPEIKDYRAEVPYGVTDIEVVTSLLPEDEAAGAAVNIKKIYEQELQAGENTIEVVLSDGYSGDEIYTITTVREAPAATTLSQVFVKSADGSIEIRPEFSPEISTYTAVVPYSVESVSIKVTPTDEEAVLETESAEVALTVGDNNLSTTVTDQLGGSAKEYTLIIKRTPPAITTIEDISITSSKGDNIEITPALNPDISTYTAVVPYSVESVSIDITPTDEEAVLETEHAKVALRVGDNNLSTIVKDQIGKNPREYKLLVERSAPLLSVLEIKPKENNEKIILVPEFIPETTVYSVTVPYKTDKLQLNAVLSEEDLEAGASVEIISEIEGELPVGTTGKVIRITYDDGKTFDYRVDITREEKDKFTFDIFGISLIPGWNITPSASFYTAGFGFKLNGAMTVRIAEDSKVNDALRPLRVGLGGHFHGGAGNYLSILSGAGYLSAEYMFQTENLLPDQWYFPKAIIPRVETGAGYYAINYTEGTYIEGAVFYLSPALRTDFIFPGLPNIDFGIDLSYTAYIGSVTVTYFSLGASISWE